VLSFQSPFGFICTRTWCICNSTAECILAHWQLCQSWLVPAKWSTSTATNLIRTLVSRLSAVKVYLYTSNFLRWLWWEVKASDRENKTWTKGPINGSNWLLLARSVLAGSFPHARFVRERWITFDNFKPKSQWWRPSRTLPPGGVGPVIRELTLQSKRWQVWQKYRSYSR
jgi:hypothetical protein